MPEYNYPSPAFATSTYTGADRDGAGSSVGRAFRDAITTWGSRRRNRQKGQL
jgi:hypothetical protein